jgi:hypothetical protein
MSGFKNASLNRQMAWGILNHIVLKVLECLDLMRRDCKCSSHKIANNEIKIRDYLFANYLNNDAVMRKIGFDNFRFFPETPENYLDSTPLGRADLQVFSIDDFSNRQRYFIIECKRLDGNLTLNREYIDEGIRRFTGERPKYTSYHKMNCMLGFIVKNIDMDTNIARINQLLRNDYSDIPVKDYLRAGSVPYTYVSVHGDDEKKMIALIHVMSNCASLIS